MDLLRMASRVEASIYDDYLDHWNEMVAAGVIRDEKMIERVQGSSRPGNAIFTIGRRNWRWGSLGNVKFGQFYAHWSAGVKKHDWDFVSQVKEHDRFQCGVCGSVKEVSHKGNRIYR